MNTSLCQAVVNCAHRENRVGQNNHRCRKRDTEHSESAMDGGATAVRSHQHGHRPQTPGRVDERWSERGDIEEDHEHRDGRGSQTRGGAGGEWTGVFHHDLALIPMAGRARSANLTWRSSIGFLVPVRGCAKGWCVNFEGIAARFRPG